MGKRLVKEWLEGLEWGEPQVAGEALIVFPLILPSTDGERDYLTLEEAFERELVEIPESGEVPRIVVKVKGEKPVLVVEGDVIVGGWQDRTVNISLMLGPKREHAIPVSCVEEGRWFHHAPLPSLAEGKSKGVNFAPFGALAFSNVRKAKVKSVAHALLEFGEALSDQCLLWEEVDKKLRRGRVRSLTGRMVEFFEHHFPSMEEMLKSLKPVRKQVGAVIGIGDKVVAVEVFDHPRTWRRLFRKVLRSYVGDAIEVLWEGKPKGLASEEEARKFLAEVGEALGKAKVVPAPVGEGVHHLLEEGKIGGFALVHKGSVRHLFAFPALSFER